MGSVFDVRLRGRIININSDHCFHCRDDGNSYKALCECVVVAVNPQMDKLLFAQSAVFATHRTSPSLDMEPGLKSKLCCFYLFSLNQILVMVPLTAFHL